MRVRAVIPDKDCLRVTDVEVDDDSQVVRICVESVAPSCKCPCCGQASRRVHSKYTRKLKDLPWQGLTVKFNWTTRRFFCVTGECSRKIFTERLPTVTAPYARRTERLSLAIRCIAFACGGEVGTRLAQRLGMKVSADTLLRVIRGTSEPARPTPRVLGVDDWAFCKGQRYGTLLCDLEKHHPVELLPERTAESFTQWLQDHDGVEIISRDRGDIYRKGATEGAPNAMQVADRFHIIKNLRDAFARFLESKSQQVREAAKQALANVECEPVVVDVESNKKRTIKAEMQKTTDRARRLEIYSQVQKLGNQGESARSIASMLDIHRETVSKYLSSDAFPERATRAYRSLADPFEDYLWERWNLGCHNAGTLWEEVKERGFKGSYASIRRFVSRWRTATKSDAIPTRRKTPSVTQVSWLLFKDKSKLSDEQTVVRKAVLQDCNEIQTAWRLVRKFILMLRKRKGKRLKSWLDQATSSEVPASIRQFAEGLKTDLEAVTAGLTVAWNNGAAEGHISRLKMIKRQMYGRANFDLLRARFLFAA
jgi:transposase